MSDRLNVYFKKFLDISLVVGLIMELAVPFGLKKAVEISMTVLGDTTEYAEIMDHYIFAIISIMLAGGLALLILFELRKMMKTVIEDNCFIRENVESLSRMANYAFAIAVVKILRNFIYFTPASLVTSAVFLFAGILSKVLAKVFDKAVSYKEENDLTI
ncbi:DUF2975 domain-containing protein [Butyrivibrio sp. INlla16]|uniref:DUF2975 domain-containing protein n=1 Tax=Butyrivibrio sp. INlla16 TaxID=1520807 RepID=UPI00088E0582|nr:DUF2975 domain-containing protein [Butyrivibrio sp. INlla16]SDB03819.1 Protein of unknown function [Butyrivibrio sp. INlla16]